MPQVIKKIGNVAIGIICISIILFEAICRDLTANALTKIGINRTSEEMEAVITGFYILTIGIMFFLSYFFEKLSFFFRAVIWICVKFSVPPGRKMAFFYAGLSFVLGSMALLSGLGIIK